MTTFAPSWTATASRLIGTVASSFRSQPAANTATPTAPQPTQDPADLVRLLDDTLRRETEQASDAPTAPKLREQFYRETGRQLFMSLCRPTDVGATPAFRYVIADRQGIRLYEDDTRQTMKQAPLARLEQFVPDPAGCYVALDAVLFELIGYYRAPNHCASWLPILIEAWYDTEHGWRHQIGIDRS